MRHSGGWAARLDAARASGGTADRAFSESLLRNHYRLEWEARRCIAWHSCSGMRPATLTSPALTISQAIAVLEILQGMWAADDAMLEQIVVWRLEQDTPNAAQPPIAPALQPTEQLASPEPYGKRTPHAPKVS
jgi:hypothetical protein